MPGSWASTPRSPGQGLAWRFRSTRQPGGSSRPSCRRARYGARISDWSACRPRWLRRCGSASGLRVVEVVPGGPAARAGLRPGDLLLSASGNPVTNAQDLQRLMFAEAIGRRMAITVMRNGALVDVIAEPSEL